MKTLLSVLFLSVSLCRGGSLILHIGGGGGGGNVDTNALFGWFSTLFDPLGAGGNTNAMTLAQSNRLAAAVTNNEPNVNFTGTTTNQSISSDNNLIRSSGTGTLNTYNFTNTGTLSSANGQFVVDLFANVTAASFTGSGSNLTGIGTNAWSSAAYIWALSLAGGSGTYNYNALSNTPTSWPGSSITSAVATATTANGLQSGFTLTVDTVGLDVANRQTNQPYATVYGALHQSLSNDTVRVNPGWFNEVNQIEVPSGVHLVIQDGATVYNNSTLTNTIPFIIMKDQSTLSGLGTIKGRNLASLGMGTGGTIYISDVYLDGSSGLKAFGFVNSTTNYVYMNRVRANAPRCFTFESGTGLFYATLENCTAIITNIDNQSASGAGRQVGFSYGSQSYGSNIRLKNCTAYVSDTGSTNPSYVVYLKSGTVPPDSTNCIIVDGLTIIELGSTNLQSADFNGYGTNTVGINNAVRNDGLPLSVYYTNSAPGLPFFLLNTYITPGTFVGTFTGDGSGLTDIPLSGLQSSGTLNASNVTANSLTISGPFSVTNNGVIWAWNTNGTFTMNGVVISTNITAAQIAAAGVPTNAASTYAPSNSTAFLASGTGGNKDAGGVTNIPISSINTNGDIGTGTGGVLVRTNNGYQTFPFPSGGGWTTPTTDLSMGGKSMTNVWSISASNIPGTLANSITLHPTLGVGIGRISQGYTLQVAGNIVADTYLISGSSIQFSGSSYFVGRSGCALTTPASGLWEFVNNIQLNAYNYPYSTNSTAQIATGGEELVSWSSIPTNAIMPYSGTLTNWLLWNWNGTMVRTCTNMTSGGFITQTNTGWQ